MAEEPPEKRHKANGWSAFGAGQAERCGGKVKILVKIADATGSAQLPSEGIACGIGYLDHMLDQLNSHGQLRVSVQAWLGEEKISPHSNDAYTTGCDHEVATLVGSALGASIAEMLSSRRAPGTFRFLVPLDEALTDLTLTFPAPGVEATSRVALAPFGKFPPEGRMRIGCFRTALTEVVLQNFAKALNVGLTVEKLRGDNAHHIVEATFKSLARCLRCAMDRFLQLDLVTHYVGHVGTRETRKQRSTKETSIDISLNLDTPADPSSLQSISTGLSTLDSILRKLSTFQIHAKCSGDVWIDEHHSTEDVMITVGQALHAALGSKAGCCRMAWAEAQQNEAKVLCVMDLSNRPGFCCDLRWHGRSEEMAEDVSVEMLHHCFESFVVNASMTVHLVQVLPAPGKEACAIDLALAGSQAMGLALKQCVLIDPRRAGVTASSKGTLST